MISDHTRAYRVVRQGQAQLAVVSNPAELITLRTELEMIRRFGAGATPGLIAVIDARLAKLTTNILADTGGRDARVQDLQEMKGILGDAISETNAQAVAEIDRSFPEIKMRLPMDTIDQETQQFRQAVAEEAMASDADVDAMLAAFEQAATQVDGPPVPTADANVDDAMVESLLNEAATSVDMVFSTQATDETEIGAVDPVEAAMAELMSSPATEVDTASSIESVSEQVAESLINAEQQMDIITSAIKSAAAELGEMTADVQETMDAQPELPQDTSPVQSQEKSPSVEPVNEVTPPMAATETNTPCISSTTGSPTAGVKAQIQQARSRILSELDEVLVLLERVDQMQAQADQALQQARVFEQAAARAHEASQCLAEAEAEAAKARAIFEQAQVKASSARQNWERAQQEAATAAAATCPKQ